MNTEPHEQAFDALENLGTADLKMPLPVVEALDYVANYCGDKMHARSFEPFPVLIDFSNLLVSLAAEMNEAGYVVGEREGDGFKETDWGTVFIEAAKRFKFNEKSRKHEVIDKL